MGSIYGKSEERPASAGCSCSSCDYRSLYEGSISSLAEMSSNQRASVMRLGALRKAVAALAEQHFPKQTREIESKAGRRLHDFSDAEAVSLLSSLLGERHRVARAEILAFLASQLAPKGVTLPLEDVTAWPELIASSFEALEGAVETGKDRSSAEGSLEGRTPGQGNSPTADLAGGAGTSSRSSETVGNSSRNSVAGSWGTPGPLFAARALPADSAPEDDSHRGEEDAVGPGTAYALASADGPLQVEPSQDPSSSSAENTISGTAGPEPGEQTLHSGAAAEQPAGKRRAPVELFQPPLRPGVPDSGRVGARSKRTRRVEGSLEGLPGYSPSVPEISPESLSASLRSKLTAAALLPRPVFTSDLVSVGGTAAAVEAWEADCRSVPDASPVRFIAPKSRHRHRGRLVVPASPSASPSDWWARCVDRYRAGRLYELAVVLRSIDSEVVAVALEDGLAIIRTSSSGGVGVVVVFLSSEAEEAYQEVVERVLGPLMEERLVMVALLSASADRGARDSLAEAARRAIVKNGWEPAMPVVAANSWEYADDARAAAVFVGQPG